MLKLVPIVCTAPTITIETNPAIKAYSMAVAADSFLQNRLITFAMVILDVTLRTRKAI
jgi:hypothetical protein